MATSQYPIIAKNSPEIKVPILANPSFHVLFHHHCHNLYKLRKLNAVATIKVSALILSNPRNRKRLKPICYSVKKNKVWKE
jgi:hypothetical protein